MTEIAWKNGGPLLLQPSTGSDIGLVAADQGCCCPPPPPNRCWCGDMCSYFIELVEPLAVKSPAIDCLTMAVSDEVVTDTILQSLVPVKRPSMFDGNETRAVASNLRNLLHVDVFSTIHGFPDFLYENLFFNVLYAAQNVKLGVYCSQDQVTEQPRHYAVIELRTTAGYRADSTGSLSGVYYRKNYFGRFEIASNCLVSTERECRSSTQEYLRIPTPLTITLSGDGTSSLGSLTVSEEGELNDAKEAVDTILEGTSYTFRITARESCVDVPKCCCEAEGVTVVDPDEVCDGTTSAIQDPPIDLEDITIVVDWDGLTLTLTSPFFSDSGSEAVDFSCQKEGDDPFDATERSLSATFFPYAGECVWFTSNITAFFGGPSLAQSNTISPYVGECKLNAPAGEGDTSCDFGDYLSWCSDHPYANSVTVEMIIAP